MGKLGSGGERERDKEGGRGEEMKERERWVKREFEREVERE